MAASQCLDPRNVIGDEAARRITPVGTDARQSTEERRLATATRRHAQVPGDLLQPESAARLGGEDRGVVYRGWQPASSLWDVQGEASDGRVVPGTQSTSERGDVRGARCS